MAVFDDPVFNERLFFPRAEVTRVPAGAVDAMVAVEGAELHVRWHGAATTGILGTLLLFHGNGEVVADYDASAARFAAAGCALAVVDYRGYGRSTGRPTLRNAIDDAPRVLEAVEARVRAPVLVMGRSLGASCAIEILARTLPSVAGVVVESGASNLAELVRRRGLAMPAALDAADRAKFDPLPKLARGTQPLLVLHGADDAMIAATEAATTYAHAGSATKRLVLVADRGHNDVSCSPEYWDALTRFAHECWGA